MRTVEFRVWDVPSSGLGDFVMALPPDWRINISETEEQLRTVRISGPETSRMRVERACEDLISQGHVVREFVVGS